MLSECNDQCTIKNQNYLNSYHHEVDESSILYRRIQSIQLNQKFMIDFFIFWALNACRVLFHLLQSDSRYGWFCLLFFCYSILCLMIPSLFPWQCFFISSLFCFVCFFLQVEYSFMVVGILIFINIFKKFFTNIFISFISTSLLVKFSLQWISSTFGTFLHQIVVKYILNWVAHLLVKTLFQIKPHNL